MATLDNVPPVSLRRIGIKWGLISTLAMIFYFFFMHEFDMIRHTGWRLINYAIIFAGMFLALSEVRKKDKNHNTDYLPGMGLLFMLSAVSSTSFGIFMMVYSAIDINFMPLIVGQMPHNGDLTPAMVGFQIASEIFLISTILILTVLMLFKHNTITKKFKILRRPKSNISIS